MVGKPNFKSEIGAYPHLRGSARPTAGLGPLDQEREASMADEGGASGAVMEAEDLAVGDGWTGPVGGGWRSRPRLLAGAGAGLVALAVILLKSRR